ncbi:MAG: dicarboxylate/amino acid:cation symporter [Phycisphaerales bacterium]|nr:MAG: dicarboxylate/amino acid:cation symporter [Phycisphaerales bacterium]
MRIKLHNLIFLGMILGVAIGLGLWWANERAMEAGNPEPALVAYALWWLDLLGPTIFMGALKMIIAPLILASIVAGVTSLPSLKELGSIGWKTLAYYFATTTIAVVIGLVFVLTIRPGKKEASQEIRAGRLAVLDEHRRQYQSETGTPALQPDGSVQVDYLVWLSQKEGEEAAHGADASRFEKLAGAQHRTAGDIFKEDIVQPLLMNPFTSVAANPPNALGIIFFALLLGIACTVVGGRYAGSVIAFFHGLNAVIMQVTHWLMSIAPLAICCIVAKLVAENGPGIFETLGWYCGTVIGGIAVHVCILLAIAATIGGIGPLRLWQGIREAWMIAFTTRSSAATLPVTIANVTEKLKVSPKVANFSLPLGATMNMDGTALYEGVAVIFLIQIFGGLDDVHITMTAMTTFLIFITAVLASVGAAAVPDAGLVTMVLVASAVHLPVYYIPLIFAVDAFLDMFRTSTNVLGDSIGAVVVHRLEKGCLGEAEP